MQLCPVAISGCASTATGGSKLTEAKFIFLVTPDTKGNS